MCRGPGEGRSPFLKPKKEGNRELEAARMSSPSVKRKKEAEKSDSHICAGMAEMFKGRGVV